MSEASWHNSAFLWVASPLSFSVAWLALCNNWRIAKHTAIWLLLGSLIAYRFDLGNQYSHWSNLLDIAFGVGGAGLFFVIIVAEKTVEQLSLFARPLLGYALATSFFGFYLLQIENQEGSVVTAFFGFIVLTLSVVALIVKPKDNGVVRIMAYTAFGSEIVYLAYVTVGSLIRTSAFFLLIGILVLVMAWISTRIEKHINHHALGAS